MSFSIKPTIELLSGLEEFASSYDLSAQDLIVTNKYVLEPALQGKKLPCDVLYQEEYGTGEPSDEMVDAILAEVNKKDYKRIIAIGGGTVIDISKLFVFGGQYKCQEIFDLGASLEKKRELIVIPTTCGTGSEVTNISIMEFKKAHTKKGLAIPALFPDYAVLIPSLLNTLPHEVFAASSIDALIHAMESYLSPKASPFTKMFGSTAIQKILNGYLVLVQKDFDQKVRTELLEDFLIASTYAGIAFGNAGCAAVHALSYPLGAVFHIPHGKANYLMLAQVFEQYRKQGADLSELEQELTQVFGNVDVWAKLENLLDLVLERKPLKEFGMTEAQIGEFAQSVMEQQQRLLVNTPVELKIEDIKAIYERCF